MQHHILAFDLQHWHKSGPQGPEVPWGVVSVAHIKHCWEAQIQPLVFISCFQLSAALQCQWFIHLFISPFAQRLQSREQVRCSHALAVCATGFWEHHHVLSTAKKGLHSLQEHPDKPWHHSWGPQDTPKVGIRQNREGTLSKSSSGLGRSGKGDLDKGKGKAPQLSLVKFRTFLGLSHWTGGN